MPVVSALYSLFGEVLFTQLSAWHPALQQFDNEHEFERMAADILNALGYTDVVLIAPQGGSDEGKDITFTTESRRKVLACVTLRDDIQPKFLDDFKRLNPTDYTK